MLIEKAKEILRKKEEEKKQEEEAVKAVEEAKLLEQMEREEEAKERKRQEQEEFIKKIPKEFCQPFARCWNCKKIVELNNKKTVQVVQGFFRVVDCPNCASFIVDKAVFKGADNFDKLLPYCLKME